MEWTVIHLDDDRRTISSIVYPSRAKAAQSMLGIKGHKTRDSIRRIYTVMVGKVRK